MKAAGIDCFAGTIEQFVDSPEARGAGGTMW